MSEEQGFEVIDKRRVRADAEAAAPSGEVVAPEAEPIEEATAETEAQAPGAAETAEQAEGSSGAAGPGTGTVPPGAGAGERLPAVTARDIVTVCIGQLHEIAWAQMGLVPNPTSQTMQRDLTDARLAIDCIADLVRHLEKSADPATQRELQTMLSNLRLNFVQQSQKG
jgi:Domain of unknown function (DUF1844)